MPSLEADLSRFEAWQTLLALEANPAKAAKLAAFVRRGASRSDLLAHSSLTSIEAQRAASARTRDLQQAVSDGVRLVEPEQYPETLNEISAPPVALLTQGDWSVVQQPCLAIVGTRGASTYGKAVAMKFAEAFARAGVTVVSGGALGIDAAAHKGALDAGGKTVAVLAGGLDKIYPAVHGALFRQIQEAGCLVSQFALGARPNAYKFLVRNHLIAALSQAVLLVEAPARSGALVTAHAAAEMGREVFVVPANIDNLKFEGSHALIRDGATLVTHPEQVLEQLGIFTLVAQQTKLPAHGSIAERILSVLTVQALPPEKIVELTSLEPSEVLAELTMLELEGLVIRDAGGYATKP